MVIPTVELGKIWVDERDSLGDNATEGWNQSGQGADTTGPRTATGKKFGSFHRFPQHFARVLADFEEY